MPWDTKGRMQRVWEQVRAYDADIVCLQEVDKDALLKNGTDSNHGTPDDKDNGYIVDHVLSDRYVLGGYYVGESDGQGVAVLYKRGVFFAEHHNLKDGRGPHDGIKTVFRYSDYTSSEGKEVICHDQGAVVVTLSLVDSSPSSGERVRDIVVAGTHLYWDPAKKEVQKQQCRELLECIRTHMSSSYRRRNSVTPALVIMGDLNDVLGEENCEMAPSFLLGENIGNISAIHRVFEYLYDRHDIRTASRGIPNTTITPWFMGCLDYIMYSKEAFAQGPPIGYLEFYNVCFDDNDSEKIYFPHGTRDPSDHIAVGCILRLKSLNDDTHDT